MNEAFEEITAVLLEADGYWVKRNIKMQIPPDLQQKLGLGSRACELDIVAIRLTERPEVLVVECKSYARSKGVDWNTFKPSVPPETRSHRYKLFWKADLRNAITNLLMDNEITPRICHTYALASAATVTKDHCRIKKKLTDGNMQLLDRAWFAARLQKLGENDTYQNNTVAALASFYHYPGNNGYL